MTPNVASHPRREWIWNHRWILGVWALWIGFAFLLIYITSVGFSQGIPTPWANDPHVPPALLWSRWDAGWYANVINYNYYFNPDSQSNIAFFPLFPFLVKWVAALVPVNYFQIGFVLNAIATLFSLFFLVGIANSFGIADRDREEKILLAFLLFPMSFFLLSFYTEALFLFLSLGSLFAARKKKWLIAGIFGALAALTRLPGVFLTVPLVLEWWSHHRDQNKPTFRSALGLFLPVLGLAAFSLYQYNVWGDPLLFLEAQKSWFRAFEWPWSMIWSEYITPLFTLHADRAYYFSRVYFQKAYELLSVILSFGLLIIASWKTFTEWKKRKANPAVQTIPSSEVSPGVPDSNPVLSSPLLVWIFLMLVFPLFGGMLTSNPRYVFGIAPLFILIGLWRSRLAWIAYLFVSVPLLVVLAIFFARWDFVA